MPRRSLHGTEEILDATRDLVLAEGAASATIEKIAQRSGAPVGSLYHRFGSREQLLARLWVRAVKKSQAAILPATVHRDAREAVVLAALSVFDFVEQNRDDARLLLSFRREDLLRDARSPALIAELKALNQPVRTLVAKAAAKLFGKADRQAIEQVTLAAFDIPYGVVRRHLLSDNDLPPTLRASIEAAVRGALAGMRAAK
jgi:AcrR family transcriptional regulator